MPHKGHYANSAGRWGGGLALMRLGGLARRPGSAARRPGSANSGFAAGAREGQDNLIHPLRFRAPFQFWAFSAEALCPFQFPPSPSSEPPTFARPDPFPAR